MSQPTHTRLQTFHPDDLPALVEFWNRTLADRHNFQPITATEFQTRLLACPAFDPQGLILAWHGRTDRPAQQLVGVAHALRPVAAEGVYARITPQHHLALLIVDPAYRRQGIGGRLLRAAENHLYYCPVWVGGHEQPCYGTLEGPRPPLFGSTQGLTVNAHDRELLTFLNRRGYHVEDPGDISMRADLLPDNPPPPPLLPDLAALGLQIVAIDPTRPFTGQEPPGRAEYTVWPTQPAGAYTGYVLVDGDHRLHGHIHCYPMRRAGWAAIGGLWIAPPLRRQGLGRALLAKILYDITQPMAPNPRYHGVELQTHLIHHAHAVQLYQQFGFTAVAAWVKLSKH
jgi:GNAT superfamily N-acetyltransferase